MTKKKIKFLLIDLFVSILYLSVCAFFGYLCYKEIDRRTEGRTEIALIKYKYHIAQRKVIDSVVWEMLRQNSPLYNNDMVLTSEDSSALITYKNRDTVIQLFDNAMVQIFEEAKVLVMKGDVEIETDSEEMLVQTPDGGLIVVEKESKLSSQVDPSGRLYFVVLKGEAAVVDGDWKVSIKSDGEAGAFYSHGEWIEMPVRVTSISNNYRLFTFNDKLMDVYLKWNCSSDAQNKKIFVETSSDKNFTKDVQLYDDITGDFKVLKVPVGKTYWKVYAEGYKNYCSQGIISLVKLDRPSLKAPYDESVFYETAELPVIDFSWTEADKADFYKIQISGDRDFVSILYEKDLYSQNFSINYFVEGKYYWRVVPYYGVNDIGFSPSDEVKSFSVIKKIESSVPELELEPVIDINEAEKDNDRLLFPPDNYIVESTRLKKLTFRWKLSKQNKAARIIVQFAEDKNFDFILKQIETSSDSVNVDNLPGYTVYWRICVLTEDGEKHYTDAYTLNIKYTNVRNKTEDTPVTRDEEKSIDKADQIEKKTEKPVIEKKKVTVIKKKEQKKLVIEEEKKEIKKEEKKVEQGGQGGQPSLVETPQSEPKVEQGEQPSKTEPQISIAEISVPVLKTPQESFVIDNVYLKENKSIVFSWEEDKNVRDYKIIIYKKNENELKQVFESNIGSVSEFKFTKLNVLDLGDFEWHLIAYGEQNQMKESTGSFKIEIVVPSKVKTKKPGKQYGE
ncbi:MAG: hypothetical protein IKX23_05450 [Treponema sp.]|nr:hypothetical protein [Treponema sp.]